MLKKQNQLSLYDYLICLLCACVFYHEYLGFVSGIYGRDISAMHMQYYGYLSQAPNHLGLLWNPFSHNGAPGLANIAYCMFYPINQLCIYFEPATMVRLYVFIHLLIFIVGLSFWLSQLKLAKRLIILGIILALYGYPMRSLLEYGHLTILSCWSLAPWLFWSFFKLSNSVKNATSFMQSFKGNWSTPFICLLTCTLLLGTHPQMLLQMMVTAFIMTLAFHFLISKTKLFYFITHLGMAIILAILSSSFQLIETWQSIPYTGRFASASMTGFSNDGIMTIATIIKSIFPFHWGVTGSYWGQFDYWFGHTFSGLFFMTLCLLSLFSLKSKRVFALGLCAGLLFLLSLGEQTPLYKLYLNIVPVAKMFRLPFRYIYFVSLVLIPLTLFALQYARSKQRFKWSFITILTIQLIYVLTHTFLQDNLIKFYQSVFDQRIIERLNNFGLISSSFLWKWFLLEVLACMCIIIYLNKKASKITAIIPLLLCLFYQLALNLHLDSSVPEDFYKKKFNSEVQHRVAVENLDSNHNIHLNYGLKTPAGYDSLSLYSYKQFLDTLIPQNWNKHTKEQVYNLYDPKMKILGFDYIAKDIPALQKGPSEWTKANSLGQYYLTQNYEWEKRKGSEHNHSIIEKQKQLQKTFEGLGFTFTTPKETLGTVTVISHTPEKVLLKVNSPEDAILASSENNYHFWKAKINGEIQSLHTWLGTFRCLPLKKGEYTIKLYVDRSQFNQLFSLSIFLTLIILAWLFYSLKLNLVSSHKN